MANEQVLTAEQVLEKASQYLVDEDIELVARAYEYARDAHSEQYRKSGEPYIIHPIQVAGILVDLHMDPATVSAGFLHDVVEDTEITLEDIERNLTKKLLCLLMVLRSLGRSNINLTNNNKQKTIAKCLLQWLKIFELF